MERLLDPKSTGLIVSNMLNDKSLHNISRTSKRNIYIPYSSELKKRKYIYMKKKSNRKHVKFDRIYR